MQFDQRTEVTRIPHFMQIMWLSRKKLGKIGIFGINVEIFRNKIGIYGQFLDNFRKSSIRLQATCGRALGFFWLHPGGSKRSDFLPSPSLSLPPFCARGRVVSLSAIFQYRRQSSTVSSQTMSQTRGRVAWISSDYFVTSLLRGENARGRVVRSFSRQNLVAARQKTADNYLLAESFLV